MNLNKIFMLLFLLGSNRFIAVEKLPVLNFLSHKAEGDMRLGGNLTFSFLQKLYAIFGLEVFVETGTYDGGTTQNAARVFKEVYSVELKESFYNNALKNLAKFNNIHLYQGHSPSVLKKIITQLNQPTIFWLDAHRTGPNAGNRPGGSPVLEELKVLKDMTSDQSVIIIDDIRLFGSRYKDKYCNSAWGFPTLQEVADILLEINDNYFFALVGDMLIVYDKSIYKVPVSDFVKACSECLMYDFGVQTEKDLIEAETLFANIKTNEYEFFKVVFPNSSMYYYSWWNGMINFFKENNTEALKYFNWSINKGYNSGRILYYYDLVTQKIVALNQGA